MLLLLELLDISDEELELMELSELDEELIELDELVGVCAKTVSVTKRVASVATKSVNNFTIISGLISFLINF